MSRLLTFGPEDVQTVLTFGPEDVQIVLTFGPEDVQTVLTFGPEDVQTVYIVTVSSVTIGKIKAMLRSANEFLLLLNIFLVRLE